MVEMKGQKMVDWMVEMKAVLKVGQTAD